MRLLTIPFLSSAQFLSHYSSKHPDGALFCRTRTELEEGEAVLAEISFPGLPNRTLVRAQVLSLEPGKGAWLTFAAEDASTREFLVRMARGELEVTAKTERSHDRFPTQLPVAVTIAGDAPGQNEELVSEAHTGDLSASGVFVRSDSSPAVGTHVQLVIHTDEGGGDFSLEGEVSWTNADGFGVHFRDPRQEDNRRLRTLLRRASESGRVKFAQLPN